MLYEQWGKIAAERRDALALRDLASGRRWTFGELHAAGEAFRDSDGGIVYPQGNSPESLLTLLSAAHGKVVSH
jgi:hypothetical protein